MVPAPLRSKVVLVWVFILGAFLFFLFAPLPNQIDAYRDATVDDAHDAVPVHTVPHQSQWKPTELKDLTSKYAYATFLAGNDKDEHDDVYLLGARILAYQLLHAQGTKTNNSIPFVVIVTKTVSPAKMERLQKDGAVVVVVDDLVAEWIVLKSPINARFKDVMTKLRLWELTQFERICLIDGDTILMDNIDGVFDDPAVKTQQTQNKAEAIKDDEAPFPHEYAFASTAEPKIVHDFPPTIENNGYRYGPNYLNSGFIVFQPSAAMFNYYTSLLDKDDQRWGEALPEQNLLNWAHRRPHGNMPWQTLDRMWNIHFPTVRDMEAGVKSLHEKFWNPEHQDLKPYLERVRDKMVEYFEKRDKEGS
ncbi:nucleotide-diphospho-sugar transferase [Ophiobolus disseminans]|uniref:Nucleotide-diphospho-sugar transferase n=1 Tax=Ophiobolus disseminans TaxID=1469910 RepID=A0A6A6ZWL8_9PLEO|nr:nucleotide-diphospho-sugar transferase [Ophiobolus disseminans]